MKSNKLIKKAVAYIFSIAVILNTASGVFAANLPAPKVEDGYKRYEAEEAEMINGANNEKFGPEKQDGQSGTAEKNVVGNFATKAEKDLSFDFGNTTSLRFKVTREEAGVVEVTLGFRSSQEADITQKCADIPLKCNDGTVKVLKVASDTDTPKKQASVKVDMKKGENIIYVGGPIAGGGWINIDYIDVSNTTEPGSIEDPEVEATPLPINPVIKTIYTADPSAHVWSTDPNTLYVYPSHDRYPNIGCNRMDAFHIYSTTNMVDYTDCGEIFSAYDLEWGREAFSLDKGVNKFDDGTFMWAPDAAYSPKTKKYYFYYPRPADEYRDEWRVGVAVSDFPDHGFVDTGIPIAGIGGKAMIDPGVFTDDDGTSYLYLGGGGNSMNGCAVAKLNDDMVTLAEPPKVMIVDGAPDGEDAWDENGAYIAPVPADEKDKWKETTANGTIIKNGGIPDYHEGPFVFKKGGTYYLMYADGYELPNDNPRGHNRQRYVYSDSPYGPWKVPTHETSESREDDHARGVILDSLRDFDTNQDTSHGSIVGFKEKWYMFYHDARVSEGKTALRSVCVDEVTFNPDGSINMVQPTDGEEGILIGAREEETPADKTYEAEDAEHVTLENPNINSTKPGIDEFKYNDENIEAATGLMYSGAYIQFDNVDGGEKGGRVNIKLKYSAKDRGYVKLHVNDRDYSFINLMGTGGKGFFNKNGESNITVTMKPGETNTIKLSEFSTNVSLDKIELRYMDK